MIEQLRQFLETSGMSQNKAADRMGVSRSALSGYLNGKQDNPDGEELWAFGWLVHKHRSRSGLLVRGGLMRTLVWPYLFKNYSVRDLAEFLEIYGLPTRLGKYAVGADETDKTTLLRAVKEIGHNAAGIIPETMNIELLNAANGSSEPFMAMIDWADMQKWTAPVKPVPYPIFSPAAKRPGICWTLPAP